MATDPIITNHAQSKMREHNIYKDELLAAFRSNTWESRGNRVYSGLARMGGYEIGCFYKKDPKGQWIIITCWKRKHM